MIMYSSTSPPSSFSLWELLKEDQELEIVESETEQSLQNDSSVVWSNSTVFQGTDPLPIDMQFNSGHLLSVIMYSILFVFSAIGNITVLVMLLRRRKIRLGFPPMDFMLLNLAIADLIVTFLMMPLEAFWSFFVSWHGGDILCRIMAFFRIFGLFLSSFVLVCLAVDRFMAVKFPMQTLAGERRSRVMITFSWILSVFCSAPQVVLFQVESHPIHTWYRQCRNESHLTFPYFLFSLIFMYLGPFIIILVLYCGIVIELIKRHQESKRQMHSRGGGEGLRRSGIGNIGKAKEKALKMTVWIIAIFFVCWSPYYIMSLWFFIDRSSFSQLDPLINKALFFFACTNSTINPILSWIFHLRTNANTLQRNNRRTIPIRQGFEISGESLCQRQLQTQLSNTSLRLTERNANNQIVSVFSNHHSPNSNVCVLTREGSTQVQNPSTMNNTCNNSKPLSTPLSYV